MPALHHRRRSVVVSVVFLALLLPGVAGASPGDSDVPYDGHDTVPATASPYGSTAPLVTTNTYDSAAFTTSGSERDVNGAADGIFTNMTGCGASPPYWGGRSGWVRFDSAVSGTLRVDVSTAGYDPIVVVWNAPAAPLGTTQYASMLNQDCNGVRADSQEALSGIAVQANRAVHVETLGFCGRAAYWTGAAGCTDGSDFSDLDTKSPGGLTSVTLTFQCTNSDGDDACDSVDGCPAIVGMQDGCPDRDRDGSLDAVDACPDLAGTDSGCPADQDGDDVANASDQCPTQKGYAPSGCPDGDADGVFFPADDCPEVKGIVPDGCADGDGDGISDRRDRCPKAFGASNGCLAVLGAKIQWQFMPGTFRLKSLRFSTLKGSKVQLRCVAARPGRCAFQTRTYIAGAQGRDVKALFRNRSLRARPFRLTFRVTKRGYLGTYKSYVYNGRISPSFTELCIAADGKLKKCPD